MSSPTPDISEINTDQFEKEEQYYAIPDKGRQYLPGKLDTNELE